MKRLCVFCGSGVGYRREYTDAASELGEALVAGNIELVYGGGSIGLMGILADKVLEGGGQVTGVIPKFLNDLEVGHKHLDRLIIVDSMHERKQHMAQLAQGFVALPGGIGTMEELMEIFTWSQLNLVRRPVAILNTNGFYDPLIQMLDTMVQEGFLKKTMRATLIVGQSVPDLLKRMLEQFSDAPSKAIDKT